MNPPVSFVTRQLRTWAEPNSFQANYQEATIVVGERKVKRRRLYVVRRSTDRFSTLHHYVVTKTLDNILLDCARIELERCYPQRFASPSWHLNPGRPTGVECCAKAGAITTVAASCRAKWARKPSTAAGCGRSLPWSGALVDAYFRASPSPTATAPVLNKMYP
jgi:hypothetical protein